MLISQPVTSCLTNHSELCMSRLRNNQSSRISIYRRQRRPSFGFESSVSSTTLIVMTLWVRHCCWVAGVFTDQFTCSGPDRANSPVCVCLSVWTMTCELNDLLPRYMAWQFILTPSRSHSNADVIGKVQDHGRKTRAQQTVEMTYCGWKQTGVGNCIVSNSQAIYIA